MAANSAQMQNKSGFDRTVSIANLLVGITLLIGLIVFVVRLQVQVEVNTQWIAERKAVVDRLVYIVDGNTKWIEEKSVLDKNVVDRVSRLETRFDEKMNSLQVAIARLESKIDAQEGR